MPLCLMTRSSIYYAQLIAASWWVGLGVTDDAAEKEHSFICDLPGTSCPATSPDPLRHACLRRSRRCSAIHVVSFPIAARLRPMSAVWSA